ncbi:MAG: sigma-54-dependent transcriptional regulator [Bacteroidaceae bacterium]
MTKQGTLLVVDDNRNILTTVRMLMEPVFERIATIANPAGIPAHLRELRPDVVLLDMNFSRAAVEENTEHITRSEKTPHFSTNNGNEGLYWLERIKQMTPQTRVVLFTAYADINLAVRGIKEGATDFVVKPFSNERMLEALISARDKDKKSQQKEGRQDASGMFWGSSPAMNSLRRTVEKVAATDANILITGENGTGKEVLAHEIHRLSARAASQLLPVDMGAISETLFESELFGHVKGAFTDAQTDRPGKLELANGGTLFLDEIGNLSYRLQAKLLTALQRRSIVRVGSSTEIPVDVRLVCATNRDLQQMVDQGTFREDLLYRINTIHLHLPPLRQRAQDIIPLAATFVKRYADMYGKEGLHLSAQAEKKLGGMPWYGNIRELQHAMEKAVILSDGGRIEAEDIDGGSTRREKPIEEVQTLDEMERRMIERTIKECTGNLSVVAVRLGISRQTLYNKIKRYGL